MFQAYNDVSNMIARLFHCAFASPVDPVMLCVQMDNEIAAWVFEVEHIIVLGWLILMNIVLHWDIKICECP